MFVWVQAHAALEEMRGKLPGIQLGYYVNMKTIEAIHRALDIPLTQKTIDKQINGFSRSGMGEEEEGEFVEEDVIDDSYATGENV